MAGVRRSHAFRGGASRKPSPLSLGRNSGYQSPGADPVRIATICSRRHGMRAAARPRIPRRAERQRTEPSIRARSVASPPWRRDRALSNSRPSSDHGSKRHPLHGCRKSFDANSLHKAIESRPDVRRSRRERCLPHSTTLLRARDVAPRRRLWRRPLMPSLVMAETWKPMHRAAGRLPSLPRQPRKTQNFCWHVLLDSTL